MCVFFFQRILNGKMRRNLEHTIVFEKVFECFKDSDMVLRIRPLESLEVDSGKDVVASGDHRSSQCTDY